MSLKEKLNADLLEEDYEEDEDTQVDKFLTFLLCQEEYGIEIRYVTEIIGIQNITEVPDMPHYIKGVINLRGKVIPVMDVRQRFSLQERAYDDRTCIIVINIDEQSVGLIVDRVSEVLDIPEAQVEPSPKVKSGESSRYIQGMGKVGNRVKILLDARQLMFDPDQEYN